MGKKARGGFCFLQQGSSTLKKVKFSEILKLCRKKIQSLFSPAPAEKKHTRNLGRRQIYVIRYYQTSTYCTAWTSITCIIYTYTIWHIALLVIFMEFRCIYALQYNPKPSYTLLSLSCPMHLEGYNCALECAISFWQAKLWLSEKQLENATLYAILACISWR